MGQGSLFTLNVIELGHYIAGPYCGKLMADSGANVIKIERPGPGDGARRLGPFPDDVPHPERSGLFLYLNTSKRGITLNLKSVDGRAILLELARKADVLIENFRPGVMERLGLDYETLAQVNPRLIVTSISNFGQTGPHRDYQADEMLLNAMGGITYISGAYDREPLSPGLRQAQFRGGQYSATATMIAVRARRKLGVGQHVDVSISECITAGTEGRLAEYTFRGGVVRRQPKGGSTVVDAQPVAAKGGYVVAGTARFPFGWTEYANFIGDPVLLEDRFSNPASLALHAQEYNERLGQAFQDRDRYELFHGGQAQHFPFGVVQDARDVLDCPHLGERKFFVEVDHPEAGRLRYPGAPFKSTETQPEIRRPAPLLGQHNGEIYIGELGMSKAELVRLRQNGIV